MVKLRLTRTGRKGNASYRVVAIDKRRARDGKALEYLGSFDPRTKNLEVNSDRAKYWLSVGAQPSKTVTSLLVKAGVLPKKALPQKKYQAKPGEKAQARAEAKAEKAKAPKKEVEPQTPVEDSEEQADK